MQTQYRMEKMHTLIWMWFLSTLICKCWKPLINFTGMLNGEWPQQMEEAHTVRAEGNSLHKIVKQLWKDYWTISTDYHASEGFLWLGENSLALNLPCPLPAAWTDLHIQWWPAHTQDSKDWIFHRKPKRLTKFSAFALKQKIGIFDSWKLQLKKINSLGTSC